MVVIPHLMRNPWTLIMDSRFRGNDNLSIHLLQSTSYNRAIAVTLLSRQSQQHPDFQVIFILYNIGIELADFFVSVAVSELLGGNTP
jgi:hypothetical protein